MQITQLIAIGSKKQDRRTMVNVNISPHDFLSITIFGHPEIQHQAIIEILDSYVLIITSCKENSDKLNTL